MDTELTVTLGYKVLIISSKCLDLDYFELFLDSLFGGKIFSKRLR